MEDWKTHMCLIISHYDQAVQRLVGDNHKEVLSLEPKQFAQGPVLVSAFWGSEIMILWLAP